MPTNCPIPSSAMRFPWAMTKVLIPFVDSQMPNVAGTD
ncbi:unnamed protein product [Rhodiola kirilowii]